jgi:hypothetical protein
MVGRFGYLGFVKVKELFNRKAVASNRYEQIKRRRNRFAVAESSKLVPRVAEAATLGWRTEPRCGLTRREKTASSSLNS